MGELIEDPKLRDRRHVFRDRAEAGKRLLNFLEGHRGTSGIVLAIPLGGIPVAREVADRLSLPLDLVVVRKLQIPFDPEAGFGAMGIDEEMILNESLVSELGLTDEEVEAVRRRTLDMIRVREDIFRDGRSFPELKGKTVILVDDGLASGYTMLAAVRMVKRKKPARIIVAVPTGAERTVAMIQKEVDVLICLNVRCGPFAVADAYRKWQDLTEEESLGLLQKIA
jgi:putative phosphoribosyl transferase